MARIGRADAPIFIEFQRALEDINETAQIEIVTTSNNKFKIKKGELIFNNGIISFPFNKTIIVIPITAIDHVIRD